MAALQVDDLIEIFQSRFMLSTSKMKVGRFKIEKMNVVNISYCQVLVERGKDLFGSIYPLPEGIMKEMKIMAT